MQVMIWTEVGITGTRGGRAAARRVGLARAALAGMVVLTGAGCSGELGYRSVEQVAETIELPPAIRRVRIVSATGSLEVDSAPERQLRYRGECLRAAETAAALQQLQAVAGRFTAAVDPAAPDLLVVRGPQLPPEVDRLRALLGLEARLWLPADVAVEIEVAGSGHLTATNRQADVHLTTGRGDLRISCCQGKAVLVTGAGTTIVDRHEGDLEVRAGAGDMQVWVRQPADEVKLVTGPGNIRCHLPPTCGFQLDGRTQQGKAGAGGFGIQAERKLEFASVIRGIHGDGRTQVVLRSAMGNLSLQPHVFE